MRWLLPALLFMNCATLPKDAPPLEVAVVVTGVKAEEQRLLAENVCAIDRVRKCEMRVEEQIATLELIYDGDLTALRAALAKLPHPGLDAKRATAELRYDGFDNLAPQVRVLSPASDATFSVTPIEVVVEIVGDDVAGVRVDGQEAERDDTRYSAFFMPLEGRNEISIVVADVAGNERELRLPITLDTTPPELRVEIERVDDASSIVRGKVIDARSVEVDGKEIEIGLFGDFETVARRDPDKRTVDIRATDKQGNAVRELWSLDDGTLVERY